jgi:flagellar biosynthesis protein FliP
MTVDEALRTLVPAQYRPQLDAIERGLGPLRDFLARNTRDADRQTFQDLATRMGNQTRGDEMWVLAPAFITTELREAFAIAILIFVPFLVIDLVVGLGLASLGLQTTSPQTVALPLKLVLFVAVDGWRLLLDALLRGYA